MTQDPLGFELFNEIGIIDQLAGTMFERAMPRSMTRAQFTVLNHFVRLGHHERSPAELASAFQVTRPTMTSTLSRMERAGLVSIRADPGDGRAKLVSVTDKGRAMRETCIEAVDGLLPLVHQVFPGTELEAILPVLRRLRVALDGTRDR
jgi:DNA-binding MarR family transcriptional regulator